MVGDLWATHPAAHLRVAFAQLATEVAAVDGEDSGYAVFGDTNGSVGFDLVERSGKGMNEPSHRIPSFMTSSNLRCNQRIFDS